MTRIRILPGVRIEDALDEVVKEARLQGRTVRAEFNGLDLIAEPGMTPSTVYANWTRERSVEQAQMDREARVRLLDTIRTWVARGGTPEALLDSLLATPLDLRRVMRRD